MAFPFAHRLPGMVLLLALSLGAGCARILPDALTPEEHLELGLAYEYAGDIPQAEQQYRLAAPSPSADFYLGNLLMLAGQEDESLRLYRTAHAYMPDNPHLNNNLAWLLLVTGSRTNDVVRLQEAEDLARQAVDAAPPEMLDACRDTQEKIRQALQRAQNPSPAETTAPETKAASLPPDPAKP